MDLAQLLARIASEGAAALTADERAFVATELAARAAEVDIPNATADDIAMLEQSDVVAEQIREADAEATALQEANATRAAELAARIRQAPAADAAAEGDTPAGGDATPGEAEAGGDEPEVPTAPPADPGDRPPQEVEDQPSGVGEPRAEDEAAAPMAVAAGATPPAPERITPSFGAITSRRPRRADPAPASTGGTVITASAEVPGVTAGQPLTVEQLDIAIRERWRSLDGRPTVLTAGGDPPKYPVARIRTQFPQDRVLVPGDAERNQQIMDAVTAAGGPCAPVAVDYGVAVIGTAERRLQAALRQFQGNRGGVRFMQPPRIGTYAGGVSVWTQTTDASAGALAGTTTKPCVRITCGDEVVVRTEAIPVCGTIGNWIARNYPERVQAFRELLGIEAARFVEARHLTAIGAGSTVLSAAEILGATSDLLSKLDLLLAGTRDRFRMADNAPIRWMAHRLLRDMLRADFARRLPGDQAVDPQAITDAQIEAWLRVRGVNVTWLLDGENGAVFGAQNPGAINAWPDVVRSYMFPEGSWVHLDDGILDMSVSGPYHDSVLNKTNDGQIWMETFENVYFQGTWSYAIDHDICPDGSVSGTRAISVCGTGSGS